MKNKAIFFFFLSCSGLSAQSEFNPKYNQDWDNDIYGFVPGKFYVNAGLGFVNLNSQAAKTIKNSIAANWKSLAIDGKPIWFAKAEYAVSARSGVGLSFAHSGFDINGKLDSIVRDNISVSGTLQYRSWSLLGRYNFHVFPEKRFDLYGGVGIGLRANNFSLVDNDPNKNWWNFPVDISFLKKVIPANLTTLSVPTLGGEITLGMKYHILPPLAVYLEFGTAKSIVQGGAVLRF